jgi:hypothetical protein
MHGLTDHVVMADVLEIDGIRNPGHLVDLTNVAEEVRVVCHALLTALQSKHQMNHPTFVIRVNINRCNTQ